MNQTTPQATKFEDRCTKCGKPCTRVKRRRIPESFDPQEHTWQEIADCYYAQPVRFVTSCCNVPPLAVPVVKET